MKYLNKIRTPHKIPMGKQIFFTFFILVSGVGLGAFSKFLDYRHGDLPSFFRLIDRALDFHNFLGGFAPWIVLAVCIAVYSSTPVRAALNVFVFFTGMVSSYYLYSKYVAGFFPYSYAMIWVAFTVLSPFLAFLCWYAKGKGRTAYILSAGILSVLFNTAFSYGMFYLSVTSYLNVAMLLSGAAVLRRPVKEMAAVLGLGILFAVMMTVILPFRIW